MYKKKKKEKKLYSQSCSDAGTQNSKFIPLLDGYGKLHSHTCSSPTLLRFFSSYTAFE